MGEKRSNGKHAEKVLKSFKICIQRAVTVSQVQLVTWGISIAVISAFKICTYENGPLEGSQAFNAEFLSRKQHSADIFIACILQHWPKNEAAFCIKEKHKKNLQKRMK